MEVSLIMDNDSGYVSHNQESNLDSSSENAYGNNSGKAFLLNNVYMNEDALLETPLLKASQELNRFDSFDSVISSSQESVRTEFSGFEDSDRSDVSLIIPEAKPIVWRSGDPEESIDLSLDCYKTLKSLNEILPNRAPLSSHNFSATHNVLVPITNSVYQEKASQSVINNVFIDSENKENINPSETPKKRYENRLNSNTSPDLFSDEEETKKITHIKSPSHKVKLGESNRDKDIKLLKRVQSCLSGVCPPPNLTTIQMTVNEILNKIEENKDFFWVSCNKSELDHNWKSTRWPDILQLRQHGLHYNRSKVSEDFEHLCSQYAERYVGSETQSTCTVFESNPCNSQKKKFSKPKWTVKSPGRRLSHLARRRITFSNAAHLQGSSSSSILGSRARQILVDAKKLNSLNKKSPRKTPSKSPFKIRKNTPSSSAKKKLAIRFRELTGEIESIPSTSTSATFKRALFCSPTHGKTESASFSGFIEKKSTKRALFVSPLKNSPQKGKSPFKIGKRKRNDSEDEVPSKFARSFSLDIRPSKPESKLLLSRTFSESSVRQKTEELSEQHKKKLQWAVYEALRLQNITASHPQYKIFASVLARVTRKFLPNARLEGRTTEKMFRIARHHSLAVAKGKTVDEIVNEYMRNRLKNQKPQGYVGLEVLQSSQNKEDKENILQSRNIIESIEKRREHASGTRTKFLGESRIDRIKKVISFEDNVNKKII